MMEMYGNKHGGKKLSQGRADTIKEAVKEVADKLGDLSGLEIVATGHGFDDTAAVTGKNPLRVDIRAG